MSPSWSGSVTLGRPEEARTHYQDALKVATDMRFRPEIALIRLQLTELLLEHYPEEKSEALEHLDFAIAELSEMKMRPSLQRALRHKEILRAWLSSHQWLASATTLPMRHYRQLFRPQLQCIRLTRQPESSRVDTSGRRQ